MGLAVVGVLAHGIGMMHDAHESQAVAARGTQVWDVTTVVITSTLVNFALDSPLAGGTGEHWARRAGAVLSMGAGGALGALVVRVWSGAGALVVAGGCMALGAGALARVDETNTRRGRR